MHIFQTNDIEGQGHHPRGEIPEYISEEEIKVTGKSEVEMDYPEIQDLSEAMYLDTYTGKAYQGRRGLMVHLGQRAGKDNIPEDVTKRHEPDDFPIVKVDDDGNITEVIKWPEDSVPPVEPYLDWYEDEDRGYIQRSRVKEFIENIEESELGAASAEKMREELL
jgi:hypothetical protein